jgi:hypothetical protein
MTAIVAVGQVDIPTNGKEYGIATVKVRGMDVTDSVQLTSRSTNGGLNPLSKGPLFSPFLDNTYAGGFDVLVYDIAGAPHNVTVRVEYAVLRP